MENNCCNKHFQDFNISFPLCSPFKTLIISLLWPSSTVHFMIISQHFYGLLYIYFSVIFRKLRNLRFNFRHILNGFICLIFLVEFSFLTIQFVFVYLFGCLYSSYLFGCGHSSIHPHTYWFSSLSQFSELFSYSYLSVIYS